MEIVARIVVSILGIIILCALTFIVVDVWRDYKKEQKRK